MAKAKTDGWRQIAKPCCGLGHPQFFPIPCEISPRWAEHRSFRFREYTQITWPTLLGCKSVGLAVRRSIGRKRAIVPQSTAMRVAAMVPLTSDIGAPTPTAS